ncbi:hypothetical protein CHUAL_004152 [Chamberlinius hualienensis]
MLKRLTLQDYKLDNISQQQKMSKCDWNGFLAAVFYGVCSAGMAFANKAVISSYQFDFPFTILVLQMLFSIAVVQILRFSSLVNIQGYTFERGKTFLIPAICSGLHSCLSLIALKGMNIPMYGALKRCTPLVNLVLSVIVLKKPFPSNLVIYSIILITIGCLIAGFGDLSFDSAAYTVGIASVVIQGLYQTLVQRAYEKNMSVFEIFQLNCFNCLPLFVVGSLIYGEPQMVPTYYLLSDPGFILCLSIVVVLGTVLNYSLFLSTGLNSALTTSIVGVFKSVVQTAIGFFTFGGVAYNPVNVAGIVLNSSGGALYAFVKLKKEDKSSGREKLKYEDNGEVVEDSQLV